MRTRISITVARACLLLFALSAAAPTAEAASLVIQKDGVRRVGTISEDSGVLTVVSTDGEFQVPLSRVTEIVGAGADLVAATREVRLANRCPKPGWLLRRSLAEVMGGDPDGLEQAKSDERWEIWVGSGKQAKKEAAEVHKHLARIINKMQLFFPQASRPEQPCKVRVFPEMPTFLTWRDRGQKVDTKKLWSEELGRFFLGDDAVMVADFKASDSEISGKLDDFKDKAHDHLRRCSSVQEVFQIEVSLGLIAHEFAIGNQKGVAAALDYFLHQLETEKEEDSPATRSPSADPTEDGEATFINYGYYSSASEELVLWKSEEFWDTISHETFHYFLQHNCPGAPIWINEGFATYFETFAPLVREKHQGFHFDRWAELKSAPERGVPFVALNDLLVLDTGTWQAQEGPLQSFLYAESWAFLHFLLHSEEFDFGNKGRKLLIRYLTSLVEGASPEEAMKLHFKDEFAPDVLQPKFIHYINRLKRPDW